MASDRDSSSVEAVNPAVSTSAPLPTAMPAGFTSTSRPFEPSVPKIEDGSVPVTRLIDVLSTEGCAKYVTLPAGTEKLRQSITECRVPSPLRVVTVRLGPLPLKLAPPCTTVAPAGWAAAPPCQASEAAAMAAAMLVALRPAGAAGAAARYWLRCCGLGMDSLPAAVHGRMGRDGKFRNQMHW